MKCPPTRACMTCNPRAPKAMYLEPKPKMDCVYCKNCGTQVLITEYQQHLETCQPQGFNP